MNKIYRFASMLLVLVLLLSSTQHAGAGTMTQDPAIVKVSIEYQDPGELKQLTDLIVGLGEVQDHRATIYVYDTQLDAIQSLGYQVSPIQETDSLADISAESYEVILSNAYLMMTVKSADGRFYLGTISGGNLLYDAYTSFLSVRVNNQVYTNKDGTLPPLAPLTQVSATSAYIDYRTPEGIFIRQTLTLSGQAAKIQVTSSNAGSYTYDVTIRYLLDTMVDVNDGSPLYAPNAGVRTYETNFQNPPFSTWQGYDFYPSPSLTAMGTLTTPPQRMAFCWWPNAYEFTWDYVTDPSQAFYVPGYTSSPTSDSCALMYFPTARLAPTAASTIITYYGVGAPPASGPRQNLINAYAELRDAVKSAVWADQNSIVEFNTKYIDEVKPNYGKMAFELLVDGLTDPAMFGADTLEMVELLEVFDTLNTIDDLSYGIDNVLSGLGANPTQAQIRDAFRNYFASRMIIDDRMGGPRYVGVDQLINAIDAEYNDTVAHLPEPLPSNYPVAMTISLLKEQAAQIRAGQDGEVTVPVYSTSTNQCIGFKLGALSTNVDAMDTLLSVYGAEETVSVSITAAKIGIIAGGLLVKGVSLLAIPVTVGGSTVTLAAPEPVIWGTVASLEHYAAVAGAVNSVGKLTTKGAMAYVSVQGNHQALMDLLMKRQIFVSSGDWIINTLGSSYLVSESLSNQSMDASNLSILSINTPNVTVAEDQIMGTGTGSVTVKNNATTPLTVSAMGDILTVLNGQSATVVGMVASENPATIQPGGQATLTFHYTVFRSSMLDSSGYQLKLFVQEKDPAGNLQYSPPIISHFYIGTSAQLAALSTQLFQTVASGQLDEGGEYSTGLATQTGTKKVRFDLFMDEGSDFDLHLYDSLNRHTGLNYDSGLFETDIPGSAYSGSFSSPEWITVDQLGGEIYTLVVIAHNASGGKDFTITSIEKSSQPALLESPGLLSIKATNETPQVNFVLPLKEYGGFHSITNIGMTISNLTDSQNHTIPSTRFSLTPPVSINPNATEQAFGYISLSPMPAIGLYTGQIQITGIDAQTGTPVSSTTEVEFLITGGIKTLIGGVTQGTYFLKQNDSLRMKYPSVDNGPVKVVNTNGDPIIASERINLKTNTAYASYGEVMGLPASKLSDTYIFPWYNNTGFLDSQLRFGNVGNAPTTVTIKIGGTTRPETFDLDPNESARVSLTGVDSGPVEVKSSNGVPIIAALRINLKVNSPFTSYSEFLGLSASSSAATRYIFPWYNNTGLLDSQLRFGNVGNATTMVTVKIGGVTQPTTYTLGPNESTRISYALDNGPVEVYSSNGVPITAALRINLKNNTAYTSYTELMGMTGATLTDTRYLFPWYNNTGLLDSQLRFGNVGNTGTIVSIKINGVVQPTTYTLAPNESKRVSLAGVDNGPVEVYSSGNVPIIAALRINIKANASYDSYYEFMGMSVGSPLGLPGNQLSTTYWFPWYNNTGLLDSQLRFGIP